MSAVEAVEAGAVRAPRVRSGVPLLPRLRAVGLGVLGLVLGAVAWEVYKALGPDDGVLLGETRVLPRTTDLAMPHVTDVLGRLLEPTTSISEEALWQTVAAAGLVSLRIAALGWVVGTVGGLLLALLMRSAKAFEWTFLPWVVLSQTVPLIAFAPVVRSWGSRIEIGTWQWPSEFSVALIAAYLAFFPVAVGALKGLQSAERVHTELLHTYAAGWWRTLRTVRLPAAVPYLLPAMRLGAAAAVVGTVVAEVSTGYLDGIGRLLVSFAGQASGDPAKAWAPILGAVVLGLVAAGAVGLLGVALRRYRRGEAA